VLRLVEFSGDAHVQCSGPNADVHACDVSKTVSVEFEGVGSVELGFELSALNIGELVNIWGAFEDTPAELGSAGDALQGETRADPSPPESPLRSHHDDIEEPVVNDRTGD